MNYQSFVIIKDIMNDNNSVNTLWEFETRIRF